MEDTVAIQQLLNRYSVSSSRGNLEDVLGTYAPDGVWEIASMAKAFTGRDAIREGLAEFTGVQDYVVQQNAPGVIEIAGDTATATSVVCERGKLSASDDAFEAIGFYVDSLVRTAAGWRFTKRSFELVSMRSVTVGGH